MKILEKITDQLASMGLPLYAVSLTAAARCDTPLLLMLHWHGFRRELLINLPGINSTPFPVPGSALQINERWHEVEHIDAAMLDAAWQLGAWDVEREERRACNYIAADAREAQACRQAFGEHPMDLPEDLHLVTEAPDREDMMQLGANVGYIRWLFRPVLGGIWQTTAEDDTLAPDGSREPPCPVAPRPPKGGHAARTTYRLGKVNRIILL